MTRDEVKVWLKGIGRNRYWLASEIGVTKTTVDGWFSRSVPEWAKNVMIQLRKKYPVPSERLALTRDLQAPCVFSIRVSGEKFDAMNRVALKKGLLMREWINQLVENEIAQYK